MTNKIKRFLSGCMIAGDLALMAAFIYDILTWQDIGLGMDLFLIGFLAVDALMTVDYIKTLKRLDEVRRDQMEEEKRLRAIREEESFIAREKRMDREMAENIRSNRTLDEMSVEELRDLLRQKESVYEQQAKR